ncbi:OmpA family protein [Hymenobacter sp. J193]|uniref:OmpA family protein n=1 Tax=Hymenobacter sp. J193 TaxID=2898429 RepID=UPI002151994A|nr:OmpA family protein [Hymenobacter sp. J193]MCR5887249.1 OmpA family protein [Hymenobacter sp. J193]
MKRLVAISWLSLPAILLACSSEPKTPEQTATVVPVTAKSATPASTPTAAAPAPAAPLAAVGFDVSQVPVANPKLGAFPYVSLIDGYQKGTRENMSGSTAKEYLKDVAFDKYEFFDGTRMIPVEGRLYTVKALGKGASFFQAQKTYEKLVKDMGGVTVFEGSGKKLNELKLKYEDGRHRARYMPEHEDMGVYMVRLPDREIWTEVYKAWDDQENYWLTVVERKALPMAAKMLPAEELKKALDANGHVAVYLNFDTDQATLRSDAAQGIGEIVKLLQQDPTLRLTVEGHTDNTGAFARNQQLSQQRAGTVVAALTAQGIEASRLRPKGLGQTKPLADNSTEEGKAKNRRVELVKL